MIKAKNDHSIRITDIGLSECMPTLHSYSLYVYCCTSSATRKAYFHKYVRTVEPNVCIRHSQIGHMVTNLRTYDEYVVVKLLN